VASGSRFDPTIVTALKNIIDHGGEEAIAEVLQAAGRMETMDV